MYDVITIGTATRDVFLQSPLFKVLKDPRHMEKLGFPTGEAQCFALGAKIEIGKPEFLIGGGAANAAVTFARQGFRAGALAEIGADFIGAEILKKLKKEGIHPLVVRDRKKKGTAWSAILLSPGGERTILNYRGASEDLALRDLPFAKLNAKWAYIVPGKIPLAIIMRAIAALRRKKAKIAMDPSKYYLNLGARRLRPILRELDVITLNREEAAYLTGVPYGNERAIFKKFDTLVKGIAVMHDGPRGVLVSDGRTIYRAGGFKEKKLVDRTGAGDAFGSGFVAGLARIQDIGYAIRLGSANATSVVEAIGAQAGILTKRRFESEPRWRCLAITRKIL